MNAERWRRVRKIYVSAVEHELRAKVWVVASVALVLVVGAGGYLRFFAGEKELPPPRIIQLTSPQGMKGLPALSPDGNLVAFNSNGENRDNWDIYVKDLRSADEPMRLTTHAAVDAFPEWSPEGRQIAFRRIAGPASALYLISPLGGPARKLADVPVSRTGHTWSPDGKSIAFSAGTGRGQEASIRSITLDTAEQKQLVKPAEAARDHSPKYSPDGRSLAFIRSTGPTHQAIYRVSVPPGEPELVTDYLNPTSFCWTADSREIIFSTSENAGEVALWRIGVAGGQPRRVAVRGKRTSAPSVSRNRLAYANETGSEDVWRIDLTGLAAVKAPNRPLLTWPSNENNASVSPDAKRIAFQSDRSGSMEIWVCGIDGTAPKQITDLKAANTGGPSWSPDGRMIVFDSRKSGNQEIWVAGTEGGPTHRLTDHPADDGAARWSRDGRWIYFHSNRGGTANIWRMPGTGGTAQPVTKEGNVSPFFSESRDGRFLYYSLRQNSQREPGLYRVPVSGGPSILVFKTRGGIRFDVTDTGIYFVDRGVRPPVLKFHEFATRQDKTLEPLHSHASFFLDAPVRLSPDGRSLYYAGGIYESEIMLVENFGNQD